MSKDAWRAFLRWLDQAGVDELEGKHQEALALLDRLTDRELKSELRRMVRLIEEERLIRLGIQSRRRKSRD